MNSSVMGAAPTAPIGEIRIVTSGSLKSSRLNSSSVGKPLVTNSLQVLQQLGDDLRDSVLLFAVEVHDPGAPKRPKLEWRGGTQS